MKEAGGLLALRTFSRASVETIRGRGGIVLEKRLIETPLLDPRRRFQLVGQKIELRRDPITGLWTRINIERAIRFKETMAKPSEESLKREASHAKCPFCSEKVEIATPKYPCTLIKEGRIKRGEAILFPNLHPFAKYHAVVTLSRDHFLELHKLGEERLLDALWVARYFYMIVREKEPEYRYLLINLNYLPPAGASIVHPHLQVVIEDHPTNLLALAEMKAREYSEKYRSNIIHNYISTERDLKERYLFGTEHSEWTASFAPLANGEVIGIIRDAFFRDMNEERLADVSHDLFKVISAYSKLFPQRGINMTLAYCADDMILPHVRIVVRPNMSDRYVNDRGFMEVLHREVVVEMAPENVALLLRKAL